MKRLSVVPGKLKGVNLGYFAIMANIVGSQDPMSYG